MAGITQDNIWLKARILSEGVRPGLADQVTKQSPFGSAVLDDCGIPVMIPYNKYSALEAVLADGSITFSEMGKVLGHGSPDRSMSDLLAIKVHYRCFNQDSGKGCRYCEKAMGVGKVPSGDALFQALTESTASVVQKINNGWRGCVMMTGGVLPPRRRHRLIERLEAVMTQLHATIDDNVLSQLQITVNAYPPDDISELYAWKKLGINSTSFDLEVMDPAFWRAICPGKAETTTHEHWIEASEAAAEIFGKGRGAMSAVVLGVEPMQTFLEGFEMLVSKGVLPVPYFFLPPGKGEGFKGFRPPAADWLVEVSEKMADILFACADTFDINLLTDQRPGFTRRGRSFGQILLYDEMNRRLQPTECS